MRCFMNEPVVYHRHVNIVQGDNIAVEIRSRSKLIPKRAKHLRIRYHYIHENVQNRIVEPVCVPSSETKEDCCTNPLGRIQFVYFVRCLVSVLYAHDHQ